jgi:hypothetical protein
MSNRETVTIVGVEYVSCSALTFGDYGGYGDIGLANIRVLVDSHETAECPMGTFRHASEGNPYGLGDEAVTAVQTDRPEVFRTYGSYGGEQVWIRSDVDAGHEYLKQLADYPSLSDDEASTVQMEWEEEAWTSWLKSDLIRTLSDDEQDTASDLPDETLREAYSAAMEETNTYPEAEYSGVHVDVDRIAESFARHLRNAIA